MASDAPRTFTQHEQALIEEVLHSDGYALLIEHLHSHAARLTTFLTTDASWDATNKARGELDGLKHFFPKSIRSRYQSDNP
jgi:hypothetical protein